MLKFFKNIRRTLLDKNKLGQYLKYALGEILLVVLGILIALQVNNWNQDRIEKQHTLDYLNDLTVDIALDLENLEDHIQFLDDMSNRKRTLLKQISHEHLEMDTIIKLVMPIYLTKPIIDRTYQKYNSTNISKLIDNKELYNNINTYYTTVKNRYLTHVIWDEKYTLEEAEFWYYNDEFESRYLDEDLPFLHNDSIQKSVLEAQLKSVKGRNLLRTSLFRKKRIKTYVVEVQNRALELSNDIKDYLEASGYYN
ncbi:DUF6090 family protein [Mangrovimonas sp. TPBH4]|uniref:DUF6090 family protein n=1 Tax=Mangrovimonas sp. TPBH4 TaxID=1645914 RepID=UPI0006B51C60|nr:DUF6090 family protein [Mangrovimonas sp. TPBH4]